MISLSFEGKLTKAAKLAEVQNASQQHWMAFGSGGISSRIQCLSPASLVQIQYISVMLKSCQHLMPVCHIHFIQTANFTPVLSRQEPIAQNSSPKWGSCWQSRQSSWGLNRQVETKLSTNQSLFGQMTMETIHCRGCYWGAEAPPFWQYRQGQSLAMSPMMVEILHWCQVIRMAL